MDAGPETTPAELARLGRPATEEEYYALGKDEPYELLDGRLVMAPASNRHEDLFGFLLTLLRGYFERRSGGIVRGSRFAMRLDPRWSPEPDLLVVLDEHRDRVGPKRLEGPADWAIEILSSSDLRIEGRLKLPRYREAGVPEIWLVDPYAGTVRAEVRQADGSYAVTTLAAGRLASSVLPGFWIDAAWLAQDPLPGALACLDEVLAGTAATGAAAASLSPS